MSEFVYCLNTSTIRPTPLLEKIRLAGEAGYTAIEPWNDEITAYLDRAGASAELKRALADAGLRVVSVIALHGWITAEGPSMPRVLDDCRRRMAQAAELGSPYIVASPPQEVVDLGRATERFAELLRDRRGDRRASRRWSSSGSSTGSRTSPAPGRSRRGPAIPRATVVADVFHMIRGGGSVDDLLTAPGRPPGQLPHQRPAGAARPAHPERRGPRDGRRGHRRPAARDRQPAHDRLPRPALARAVQPRALGAGPRRGHPRGRRIGRSPGDSPGRLTSLPDSAHRSILRQVLRMGIAVDLPGEVGGALEHHLQLAVDGDELPALGGPRGGRRRARRRGGRRGRRSAWPPRGSGSASPRRSPCRGRAVGRPHRGRQVVGADEDGVDAGDGVDLVGDLRRRRCARSGSRPGSRRRRGGNIPRPSRRSSGRAGRRRPSGCRGAGTCSAATIVRASAASMTIGATIPIAPQSRTILM